jgi:hypothetical protein
MYSDGRVIKFKAATLIMKLSSYPDRLLLICGVLLGGLFLRHVGEPEPLSILLRNPQYYVDLGFTILVTLLIWLTNHTLITRLDKQYSWATHGLQRFFIQAILAYALTGFSVLMLSFVYNDILIRRPAVFDITNVFSADIPASLIMVTIIHLLYTGMWMIHYHNLTVSELENKIACAQELSGTLVENQDKKEEFRKTLLVNQGKGLVPLEVAHVAYIYTSQEMVLVKTLEGNLFTLDASLEQLEEQLSPYAFFRISRQFIVQKKAVKKVESESSGRLLLYLQPTSASEITVSRRRTAEFRQWLDT